MIRMKVKPVVPVDDVDTFVVGVGVIGTVAVSFPVGSKTNGLGGG